MSAKLLAPASSPVLARFRSIWVPSFQSAPRKAVNANYHAVLTDRRDIILDSSVFVRPLDGCPIFNLQNRFALRYALPTTEL